MHFGYQPRSTLVQPARLEENPHIGKRRMRHPCTLAATVVLALCFVMFGAPATTTLFAQGGATERTPETLSKYRASAVEYTAREHSVTIHSRQFRGAGGKGGARRWRQYSITEEVGGLERLRLGPGMWVTNQELSPWYIYINEPKRTYSSPVRVTFEFEYNSCSGQIDEFGVLRWTGCRNWGRIVDEQTTMHLVAPTGVSP